MRLAFSRVHSQDGPRGCRDDVDCCPTGKRRRSGVCSGFAVESDFAALYDYYDRFSEGRAAGGDCAGCPMPFDYHGL